MVVKAACGRRVSGGVLRMALCVLAMAGCAPRPAEGRWGGAGGFRNGRGWSGGGLLHNRALQEDEGSILDQELFELARHGADDDETRTSVESLLLRGADPNACCDVFGKSVLHEAAGSDNLGIAEALLAKGATVDPRSTSGDTPLHIAAKAASLRVARALLEANANANAKNSLGQTPLHLASLFGSTDVVKLLLEFGADRAAVTDAGETALDLACIADCPEGAENIPNLLTSFVPSGLCRRHPYVASLRDSFDRHHCAGVLIDPEWVLTAAHCVDRESVLGGRPRIVMGGCDLVAEPGNIEITVPQSTLIFEGWSGNASHGNDIALLRLSNASGYQPVQLPLREPKKGARRAPVYVALGFDKAKDGSVALRQDLGAQVVGRDICEGSQGWRSGVISEAMVCAYGLDNGQGDCGGDNGGAPLLAAFAPHGEVSEGVPEADILMAIASFGDDSSVCGASRLPGVYTKVSSYLHWIRRTMRNNGDVAREPREQPTELDEDLLEAVLSGNLSAVLDLLARGANQNVTQGPQGVTALMAAALRGRTEIAQALIDAGADLNKGAVIGGGTALYFAALKNRPDIVASLIEAGADVNKGDDISTTPLFVASAKGKLDLVQQLLAAGADTEIADQTGATPLHIASFRGRVAVVRALLGAKANPNHGDYKLTTPLHAAAYRSGLENEQVASLLIAAGADVDASMSNAKKWTALAISAGRGDLGIARILVQSGADVDKALGGGKTAVDWVCACRRPKGSRGLGKCATGSCTPDAAKALRKLLTKSRAS